MSDLNQVLRLWQQIEDSDEDCVLATIVRVDGSSYRKPGARMLITRSGQRAGMISGGCLEGEVSKQAWWLTGEGPLVKAYSTSFEEDEDRPFGLGCGGTVHLLLERRHTAERFLRRLAIAFATRRPMACAVVIAGDNCGTRQTFQLDLVARADDEQSAENAELQVTAKHAFERRHSSIQKSGTIWAEFIPARCGLFIFGAGDDAKPLVTQASTLGWHITVVDSRCHLATRLRFPEADDIVVLNVADLSTLPMQEGDAAVVMTHSYEKDRSVLSQLLYKPIAYLGVLGPRYRTAELLKEVTTMRAGGGGQPIAFATEVHSPVGLDLGGDGPATIALSILAEIQATLSRRLLPNPGKAELRQTAVLPSSDMEEIATCAASYFV